MQRRSVSGYFLSALAALSVQPIGLHAQADRPALVVLIAVDQLRPDYFSRYESQLTGGLGRFWRDGAFFTNAWQDHAITETAPGHSTLLSGRPPASTGIVANSRGVADSTVRLIGVDSTAASPWRFRGTTLYDWMLAGDSTAQALSVSRKDRGAILPIGRARAQVFWYKQGMFTTSTWYTRRLPSWLQQWNARRGPARLAGTRWDLLLPPSAYPEPDSLPYENESADVAFPHVLPSDTAEAMGALEKTPMMDSLIVDVALHGVGATKLGRRGRPDLLVLSLSATDNIGHSFGPDSREIHDQILRLDRTLGRFMDSLAVLVPGRIVYALTADHGVQPLPEHSGNGGRIHYSGLVDTFTEELERRWHVPFGVEFDSGLLAAKTGALRSRGVNVDSLATAIASRFRRLEGVAQVYTPATLRRAATTDETARLWRRTLPADEQWLVAATAKPGWMWTEDLGWTTHGTTNLEDMHVPLAFLGDEIRAGRVARRVTTEDIGPTFAALLGVRPTEPLTGRVLVEVTTARR